MEVKILEADDTSMRLMISGLDPSVTNGIRRYMIAEVPKMAIEKVEFHQGPIRDNEGKEYESVSPLFDEILAHRLGLIPIPTDLDMFTFRDKCKCNGEGCPSCTIMYVLNKKGPATVYAGDLEPLGDQKLAIAKRDALIPIVKLMDGQAPLIYMTAVLGRGKDHAKWQAVCAAGYKYLAKISINQSKCQNVEQIVKSCPRGVLVAKGKELTVQNIENCSLCKACENACEPGGIKVDADPNTQIFTFETDGSLTAKKVLKYSLIKMEEKCNEFKNRISELE